MLEIIQRNGTLCSKIKTFKEINLDFVSSESNVFHFDMPLTLPKLLGHAPDSNCPKVLGEKLATTCITLNEFPCIRYQTSSRFATEMATTVVKILSDFKQANAAWWCNGEGEHQVMTVIIMQYNNTDTTIAISTGCHDGVTTRTMKEHMK